MKKIKLVMVGNGMVGVCILEELFKFNLDFYDIMVFGVEFYFNYNCILLFLVLVGEQIFEEIVFNDFNWYVENGIKFFFDCKVVQIDWVCCRVVVVDGSEVEYDCLLLVIGLVFFILLIFGNCLQGVIGYCDIVDIQVMIDCVWIYSYVVVIGGGLFGLEVVNGFK